MRIINLRYIILLNIIAVSCKNTNYEEIRTKNAKDVISIEIFENHFSLDKNINIFYNKNDTLLCFDILLKFFTVGVIKDDTLRIINRIKINDIGNYGSISSAYLHGNDSLFVLQDEKIYLYHNDSIKWYVDNNDTMYNFYNINRRFPLYYSASTNALYLYQYNIGKYPNYDTNFFKENIEVSFPLKTENKTVLPMKYSKKYLENYYGFLNYPNRIFLDSISVYSFLVDPNIYVYNHNTNKIQIFGGKSAYQKEDIKPIDLKYKNDGSKKIRHMELSGYYDEIIFDKYKSLYYRIYKIELPEKRTDGLYSVADDCELVLMVFDDKFNLIKEFKLGNKYGYVRFVTKNGLYIYDKISAKNEKKSLYSLICINRN